MLAQFVELGRDPIATVDSCVHPRTGVWIGVLDNFVVLNRGAIIARSLALATSRPGLRPSDSELALAISVILDQLHDALRVMKASGMIDRDTLHGSHGQALLRPGYSVRHLLHGYEDVSATITQLALQQEKILPGEFLFLDLCLDEAIAEALAAHTAELP